MGSADDDGPKRPDPTRRVFRPANAWDTQSDSIRAQPAPQQPNELKPPEPAVSQKNSPPPLEADEIKRLRQHEDQAARQQTTPTQEPPPVQQEAKAPTPAIATPDPAAAQNAERAVERGETVITFIEYSRPNGRKEEIELECHFDTKRLADGLVLKGYRFECETLPDNRISLTAVDPNNEGDVAIELCGRGSEIPNALRSLVNKAVEFDRRQELAGDLVQTPQQKPEPKPPEPAAQQEAKAPTPADDHRLSGSDQGRQAGRKAVMPPPIPNYYSELERTHQHVAATQRKLTPEEFRQEERDRRTKRLQEAAPQPNAPRSLERPAHVREADDKQSADQEATKNPGHKPEAARKLTREEFLQEERQSRAERLQAMREVTQHQKGAQQQQGPNLGGGISR